MSQNMQSGDLALTLVPDSEIPQGSQVLLAEKIERGQMLYGKDRQMAAPTAGWYVTHPAVGQNVAYGEAELMPLHRKPTMLQLAQAYEKPKRVQVVS